MFTGGLVAVGLSNDHNKIYCDTGKTASTLVDDWIGVRL